MGRSVTVQMQLDEVAVKSLWLTYGNLAAQVPSFTLGIVAVGCAGLKRCREAFFPLLRDMHLLQAKVLPYAEAAYCFRTANGALLCTEQLFASRCVSTSRRHSPPAVRFSRPLLVVGMLSAARRRCCRGCGTRERPS